MSPRWVSCGTANVVAKRKSMNCSLLTEAKSSPLFLGNFWVRNDLLHSFHVQVLG